MAEAIRLRSPRYRTSVCSTTHLSVQMTITISSVLRYTIVKDSIANQKNLFEYGELSRDYITGLDWKGAYNNLFVPQSGLLIKTNITYWNNAGGADAVGASQVTSGITDGGEVTEYGYDSYSNFLQGYNKEIPNDQICISNVSSTSNSGVNTYTVYYPIGKGGVIPYMKSDGSQLIYNGFSTTATQLIMGNTGSTVVNIKRFHCNKYENVAVDFINKFGAIQREYFILKNVTKIKAKREDYKSNIMDNNTGSYSVYEHTIQNFNIVGNEELTVNSDYLPEYYNEVFTELLLSDYVWVYFDPPNTSTNGAIPVNITNSDLTYKTQVNDRLINFSFSFKMSYDYINNIR